jgi:PAS domain S-box-containing protein
MRSKYLKFFYKKPLFTGLFTFAISFLITQFLTYKEVELYRSYEENSTIEQANLIEKRISNGLSAAITAARTLEFIESRYGTENEFEEVAKKILADNPNLDVIQLLKGGEIIQVYPLEGNEPVLGYDILEDPTRSQEAIKARDNKDIFFAGPFELKQGGVGIVGRLPIFKDNEFWGFSAVIIYLETFKEIIDSSIGNQDQFYVQLSKVNPYTNSTEYFLLQEDEAQFTGFREDIFIDWGEWSLTVILRKSEALSKVYLAFTLRFIFSLILGVVAWFLAKQPAMLEEKVLQQSQRLALSNERFKYATRATSDAIWDWDFKSGEVYRSKNFEKLFGFKRATLNSSTDFWDSRIHPDDIDRVQRNLKENIASERTYWEQEFRFKKSDGNYAFVIDKGIILRDDKGKPLRIIGATQDISKIKASENSLKEISEQLKERAKELELSNEELEKFAYNVSHDLQEPLRMISSFIKLLDKKYGHLLDEKGKQYIHFASEGAITMRQIILDLLDYSMAGNVGQKEKVCLHEVIEDVKLLHRNSIHQKNAKLIYDQLPEIVASKATIRQLFLNIIDNALKYSSEKREPLIEIKVKESPEFWHFEIADNGIGIAPEFHHQVFNIFQRLHTDDIYKGTGVGLAIAKKIIETHEGKIWVESELDKGTSFMFTIKKFDLEQKSTA